MFELLERGALSRMGVKGNVDRYGRDLVKTKEICMPYVGGSGG